MIFSKGVYARHISRIVRRATLEAGQLAEGMWNPNFCSDEAETMARQFSEEMQRMLDDMQSCVALLKENNID